MSYDFLFEPVSDEAPCGPDLDEEMDDAYLNYFNVAEAMLPPTRYFSQPPPKRDNEAPNHDIPFDKSSIDLDEARATLDGLLQRSRDLRLLVLDAKLAISGGSLKGFCDAIQAIVRLLDEQWDHLHPTLEIDPTGRSDVLSSLVSGNTVLLPLQFVELVETRRAGSIIYRNYAIAKGKVPNHAPDQEFSVGSILSGLGSDDKKDKEAVETAHAMLLETFRAIGRIPDIFIEKNGYDNLPELGRLTEVIQEILDLFAEARPDLALAETDETSQSDEEAVGETGETSEPGEEPEEFQPVEIADLPEGIKSHNAAKAALKASEVYFATWEPSSPALVLIHQARQLIGVPLIEAIDVLMPESVSRTAITVSKRPNFQINAERMRTISQSAKQSSSISTDEEMITFQANERSQAMALVSGTEKFYRVAEPSSPVPYLLKKTREYLNRDFESIINDMIKSDTGNSDGE